MAARYPKIVRDRLQGLEQDYHENRDRYIAAIPQFNAAEHVVALAAELIDTTEVSNIRMNGWLDGAVVVIRCDVHAFRDVAPLLDFVEAQGYEFRSTNDYPAGGERSFTAYQTGTEEKKYYPWNLPGIKVEAHLLGEGVAGCKRVVVRYETSEPRPVYGFDCGDPTAIPTVAEGPKLEPELNKSGE